jgi:hypothetical protein
MKRALLVLLAACNAPGSSAPRIASFTPSYGPVAGGTRVVIEGSGFDIERGGQVRVIVGEKVSPLANALDDSTIELVLPPGDRAGDVEVVVFNERGTAVSSGFHYSAAPAIAAVEPAEAIYAPDPVTVTVTGSGFVDEGAGTPLVLVDGAPVTDLVVESDTRLSFTTASRPLGRPRIEIANARGVAGKDRAFRFRPSAHGGLLLFAFSSTTFATFYDPVDKKLVSVPRTGPFLALSSAVRDDDGEYWGTDRNGGTFGRIDVTSQRLEQTTNFGFRAPALARVGSTIYGIDRWQQRFARINADGSYSYVGTSQFTCCGSFGMAYNGTTLYFTSRSAAVFQDKVINTIDPETGVMGTPIKLVGGGTNLHVEEMRFYQGTLYATSRDGTLVTIDPATGAVTVLATIPRSNAMEVFD